MALLCSCSSSLILHLFVFSIPGSETYSSCFRPPRGHIPLPEQCSPSLATVPVAGCYWCQLLEPNPAVFTPERWLEQQRDLLNVPCFATWFSKQGSIIMHMHKDRWLNARIPSRTGGQALCVSQILVYFQVLLAWSLSLPPPQSHQGWWEG